MPTKTSQKKTIHISHSNFKLAFERFLRAKMKHPALGIVSKEFDRQIKKFRIYFNEGDFIYRYNNAFMVGLNSPYVKKGTQDDAYHNIRAKLAEQVGLTRCTNRIQIQRFAISKQTRYSSRLSEYVKDLFFVLELLRTNTIMKSVDKYIETNLKVVAGMEMRYIGKETVKWIQEVQQVQPLTNVQKLIAIRDVLRFMGSTVLMDNAIVLDTKNDEINKITRLLFPMVLYAPDAPNTQTILNMMDKVLEIIDHILLDAKLELEDQETKMKSVFGFKDVGSHDPLHQNPTNSSTDEEFKNKMAKMFDDQEMKKGHKVKEKIDSNSYKNDEEDYIDIVENDENYENIAESCVSDIGSRMDVESEQSNDDDDPMNALFKKMFGDDGGNTYGSQYRPPVSARMADEYFNGNKKTKYQITQQKDEDTKINNIHVEITQSLHAGCMAYFKERSKMEMFTDVEYKELVQVIQPYINQIVRSIKALVQQAQIQSSEYEQMGTLDTNKLVDYKAFGDTNIFKGTEIEVTQMILEVMILVDNSGSQAEHVWNPKNNVHEPRYKYNQLYTIMLHEAFRKLGFPHSVWTFHEGSRKHQHMSSLIHRENCLHEDSGLYINEIGAHGCNRDGFSIRYAGHYLNRSSRTKNRLMIVISDGQPNASGYDGHLAVQDVYDAVKEVEAGGSSVIGIFTGSEEENYLFKKMYDKPVFANNESINSLPEKLKKILVEQYRKKVNDQI